MVFSEKQESLVKESWEVMKQNVPELSLRLFTLIMEDAPEAKNMFSFLQNTDEIPQNNPKLRAHAVKVFKTTCESAIQLHEKGKVVVADTTLKWLGAVHLQKGVMYPHFEVVKVALLRTVKEAMGDKWSEEMNGAWTQAYDMLAMAIKDEMKAETAAA
ncbi:unnamed protein product [Fraxinus pennsylvanica]|uniref:Globin domain-containing protein n=1 Tax=Fraxinus pennsylvanica TaxID=56036 RepID=A0AAD1ZPA3_9LAMI|nr:unnamed protein product [Fraxinus pennsylvanica]